MEFLNALRIAVHVILVVAGCCFLSLVPYAVARRFLLSRADDQTRDLAGSVIAKIATPHSLIFCPRVRPGIPELQRGQRDNDT